MTKAEAVRVLAEQYGVKKTDVANIIQSYLDMVIRDLFENGESELRNFGSFTVRIRAARRAVDPRNGTPVMVPPKHVVFFKPGKLMRAAVCGVIKDDA